jgi:hypothetical protein
MLTQHKMSKEADQKVHALKDNDRIHVYLLFYFCFKVTKSLYGNLLKINYLFPIFDMSKVFS